MRKLITILSIFIMGQSAFAFRDSATISATRELIKELESKTSAAEKSSQLEKFKDFLFKRLNALEIPDLDSSSPDDPRIEEYRSLTEFDSYVGMIEVKNISAKNCAASLAHLKAATGADQSSNQTLGLGEEAKLAEEIILSLCK